MARHPPSAMAEGNWRRFARIRPRSTSPRHNGRWSCLVTSHPWLPWGIARSCSTDPMSGRLRPY